MPVIRAELHARRRLLVSAAFGAAQYYTSYLQRRPPTVRNNSVLSGQQWLTELLESNNPQRLYDALGMKPHTFLKLVDELKGRGLLEDTKNMTVEEQLAIFLFTIITGNSVRKVEERFQRSPDTISRVFHKVLDAINNRDFYTNLVRQPTIYTSLPLAFRTDERFMPYFKDCVGAIDGTHLPVHVAPEDQARFRDRKSNLSQNVLAAANFNMMFQYVMPGYTGTMPDSSMWEDSCQRSLVVPEGKFYLGDAGFSLSRKCLVPYRGVRYHLQEWSRLKDKEPANKEELFNLRHSSARMVIERIFGVSKKRFRVMEHGTYYPFKTQVRLVPAMCAIHNFIRLNDSRELELEFPEFQALSENPLPRTSDSTLADSYEIEDGTNDDMDAARWRDEIASRMWADYQRKKQAEARRTGRRQSRD